MDPEETPELDAEGADEEGESAPPAGVLRVIGELLAAVLVVAAVLAALLIGALVAQWMFG
jgi:hypothetical protein